jgi:hypothetical protein
VPRSPSTDSTRLSVTSVTASLILPSRSPATTSPSARTTTSWKCRVRVSPPSWAWTSLSPWALLLSLEMLSSVGGTLFMTSETMPLVSRRQSKPVAFVRYGFSWKSEHKFLYRVLRSFPNYFCSRACTVLHVSLYFILTGHNICKQ